MAQQYQIKSFTRDTYNVRKYHTDKLPLPMLQVDLLSGDSWLPSQIQVSISCSDRTYSGHKNRNQLYDCRVLKVQSSRYKTCNAYHGA